MVSTQEVVICGTHETFGSEVKMVLAFMKPNISKILGLLKVRTCHDVVVAQREEGLQGLQPPGDPPSLSASSNCL